MNLFEKFGYTPKASARGVPAPSVLAPAPGYGPSNSTELERVLALPRRPRPDVATSEQLQAKWTQKLGKATKACICQSHYKRRCPASVLPVQAWALEEMSEHEGILGPIGVGEGKTLLDLLAPMAVPNCRVAVLLIPAQLREQLLNQDWAFYEQHWVLPNRAAGRWFHPARPVLHVVAYSELSGAKSTELLKQVRPDLIIADEAHNLRNMTAARSKRFSRHFNEFPNTRLVCWSGTMTSKSLRDYAKLSTLALKSGSPTPAHYQQIEEWSEALDPNPWPTNPGALAKLCEPGEAVRVAYRRRVVDTPGVVSSPDTDNCQASLVFQERKVTCPPEIEERIRLLNKSWDRPDGERLVDAFAVARCARELASGFFYRWRWPRNEPLPVRERWLAARKEWHSEIRERLKTGKGQMDSPLLLAKAAIRWYEGYTHDGKAIPPETRNGPLPTWCAHAWPEWKEVRDTAKPETEAVWISDFLVRDAVDWAAGGPGIVWYEHDCLGRAIAKGAGIPFYGPGVEASRGILEEHGDRPIVASIRAQGTGKNLQQFCRQLVANPPSDGAAWEQLIGRTHRQGQLADEVTVEVYRHADAVRDALDKARGLAQYISQSFGGSQKLLRAQYVGF
jgi:hypothetical protein